MFKIGNFLFRREIIHYTGWQNLCRDKSRTARGWQNLCRDESGRRGAGRISAGMNPDGAELAESLPGGIQTARGWQNLCREESGRREAGRTSAGMNPDGAGLAESLPGRIHVYSDRHGVCPYMGGRINVGGGQQITSRNLSLHTGTNQCGYRTDSKSPLGVLSLHVGANQCGGILIFHLSLPRANSGGTPACRDRPRVCPTPSVRQGRNKHVIRQTPNDCECIRLPRDGRTDTEKNPRGYRTYTGSVPT